MLEGYPGKATCTRRERFGMACDSRLGRERKEMGKGANGFFLGARTKILWLLSDLKIKSGRKWP